MSGYILNLGLFVCLHLEKSRRQSNLRKTVELISNWNKAMAQKIIYVLKLKLWVLQCIIKTYCDGFKFYFYSDLPICCIEKLRGAEYLWFCFCPHRERLSSRYSYSLVGNLCFETRTRFWARGYFMESVSSLKIVSGVAVLFFKPLDFHTEWLTCLTSWTFEVCKPNKLSLNISAS